jgi:DNA-directed RNA polymerase subunit RPC12/RpoP
LDNLFCYNDDLGKSTFAEVEYSLKGGNELNNDFITCPHCGQQALKGAMRCLKCGRILKTPEEQLASIEKLKESKKEFNYSALFKWFILLLAMGVLYYFFSNRIIEVLGSVLGR